jgi:hypothetical protein
MGASPVLKTFISLVSPLDPIWTPLQAIVPGVTLMTGAMPLPERVTVAALPASLAILKLALFAPRLVGVNVIGIVQLLPGATDAQL